MVTPEEAEIDSPAADAILKGLRRTQLLVSGAIFIYQLVLLYKHEQNLPIGKGIKAPLRAA